MERIKQVIVSMVATCILFLTIPSAYAARSGIAGLDRVIEILGGVFYPSILDNNPTIRLGFYKFLYFLIVFALVNWVLVSFVFKKGDEKLGKRASAIIAMAFGAISAFFIPGPMALGSAGIITAVFAAIIPFGVAMGLAFVAMKVFDGKSGSWQHLIGIILILIAIAILEWYMAYIM